LKGGCGSRHARSTLDSHAVNLHSCGKNLSNGSEQSLLRVQYFTVKCQEGVVASSFGSDKKFFIDPAKLLPLERFLPKPKGAPSGRGTRSKLPRPLLWSRYPVGMPPSILAIETCQMGKVEWEGGGV